MMGLPLYDIMLDGMHIVPKIPFFLETGFFEVKLGYTAKPLSVLFNAIFGSAASWAMV